MKLKAEQQVVDRARRGGRAGFTFVEVLAAMFFMALVIPVAIEGLRIAARAGLAAERKSVAVHLADRVLNEMIVTGRWHDSANQEGLCGEAWQGYRWTMRNEPWSEDAMRQISVEVRYPVQDRDFSVCLSTVTQDVKL